MDAIAVQMEARGKLFESIEARNTSAVEKAQTCSSWPQAAFSPKARCRPMRGIDPGLSVPAGFSPAIWRRTARTVMRQTAKK